MLLSPDIPSLVKFLHDFRQVEQQSRERFFNNEKHELINFFKGLRKASEQDMRRIKVTAPAFNVFNVLNISHLEDHVHSPWLACLLNVQGQHAQGDLFFRAFMKHIFPKISMSTIHQIEVCTEYSTYNGIFDIFLKLKIQLDTFYVVIENKVNARDQPQQMERYYLALQALFNHTTNFLLIYLTPNGKRPSEESLPVALYHELTHNGKLQCMSYQNDIVTILQECIADIEAPIVRDIIGQYIETIKTI